MALALRLLEKQVPRARNKALGMTRVEGSTSFPSVGAPLVRGILRLVLAFARRRSEWQRYRDPLLATDAASGLMPRAARFASPDSRGGCLHMG